MKLHIEIISSIVQACPRGDEVDRKREQRHPLHDVSLTPDIVKELLAKSTSSPEAMHCLLTRSPSRIALK